jgi:hypothetical protein
MVLLHETYEKMIVAAWLDPAFAARLLADPCQAALDAGFSPLMAHSLAGLRAATLADFAAALHRRLYGTTPARTAPAFPTAAGQAGAPRERKVGGVG